MTKKSTSKNMNEPQAPVVASNVLLGEESHKPSGWNPDYVDRNELLVHISKRHKEWIEDAQGRKTDLVRGISIGNAMALEELHGWVKAWTPNPSHQPPPNGGRLDGVVGIPNQEKA